MKYTATIFAIAAFLVAGNLFCDDKDKAKEHFLKGKTLVEDGAYDKAIVELEASYKLNPVPIVLYNIGLCYDEMHKYAEAMKNYRQFLAYGNEAPVEMRNKVNERIKELAKLIGLLKLDVDVEGAEVIVDNKLVGHTPTGSILIETGEHDLALRKTSYPDIKKKFKIVSGETTELSFSMEKVKGKEPEKVEKEEEVKPPPDEVKEEVKEEKKPSPKTETGKKRKKLGKAPFWAVTAVALASFAGAAVTGGLALDANSEFNDQYYEDRDSWEPLQDRTNNLAITTDVLIGVGAASAVAALVLFFFTDFKRKDENNVTVKAAAPCGFSGSTVEWRF